MESTVSSTAANELRRLIKNGDLERAPEINLGLFSAARGEIWREKIKPALDRGAIVLSARNYYSSLAYQGRGEGMDEAEIIRMTRLFTDEHYMQPDVAVILTLSDAARAERIAMRGELKNPDTFESRGDDFQTRVNQAYIDIAKQYNIPTIDASGTVEEVQATIWEHVARRVA
jgi:dTMP kinase